MAGRGFLWCPVLEGLPEEGRLGLFRHSLDTLHGGWERVASIETAHGVPSLLLPLEDDYFLGISNGLGFSGDAPSDCSFVARFRLKENRLEYDATVELPLPHGHSGFKKVEYPYLGPGRKTAILRVCEPPCEAMRPCLWPPSVSEGYLALAAPASDIVWILDLAKGRVRTTLSLLGLSARDLERLNPLKDVILGTAFAPDGRLLIATRHPELVDLTVRLAVSNEKAVLPGGADHGRDAVIIKHEEDARFKCLAEQQQTIQWWSWGSEHPSAEKLDASALFPNRVPTLQRQERFRFLVDAHGSVRTNAHTPWNQLLEDVGIPREQAKTTDP